MRQRTIIASLGALAATGLAVYLIRRRNRIRTGSGEIFLTNTVPARSHTKPINKSKAFVYEPDDHPE